MRSIVLIDVTLHLLFGIFVSFILWPFTGPTSLIIIFFILLYLAYTWVNADLIVAKRAGFRSPTLVQRRYLEYLGIDEIILTHPSILPLAATLETSSRRLILLTATVFKELSDDDIRTLVTGISSRDKNSVIGWTFHLATGGASLFSRAGSDDPSASWGIRTLLTGAVSGIGAVLIAAGIAAMLSPVVSRPIDISPIMPAYWLPFLFLILWAIWRQVNLSLIKPAAANWNKPIIFENVIYEPISKKIGGHPNLNLMRHGLLIANKNLPFATKPFI